MSFFLYFCKRILILMFQEGHDFQWVRGETLLSGWWWPVCGALLYLLTIAACKALIKAPVSVPKHLLSCHNLVLSIGSGVMFIGCISSVVQEFSPSGRLFFWSYVYYLSKYYECLDTVLLALRMKPTTLLHVYHHAVVILMSWLWVDQVQSLQFIGLLANTAVHVVMYYYYHLTTVGRSPWWKKYITTMQIIQFTGSFMCLPAYAWYQAQQGCKGNEALGFNAAFNATLLLLFIQFYRTTYRKKQSKKVS